MAVRCLGFHEKAGRCQVICGWVSSYLLFSFARIAGVFWLARRQSRPSAASSSGALTAAAGSLSKTVRAKENIGYAPFLTCSFLMPCRAYAVVTLPSALLLSDSALGAHWVSSVQSALPSVWRPLLASVMQSGPAQGAVAGTRRLAVLYSSLPKTMPLPASAFACYEAVHTFHRCSRDGAVKLPACVPPR